MRYKWIKTEGITSGGSLVSEYNICYKVFILIEQHLFLEVQQDEEHFILDVVFIALQKMVTIWFERITDTYGCPLVNPACLLCFFFCNSYLKNLRDLYLNICLCLLSLSASSGWKCSYFVQLFLTVFLLVNLVVYHFLLYFLRKRCIEFFSRIFYVNLRKLINMLENYR
jgi:hypothetical protein